MSQSSTDQVRQVLMNEMGLTRDSIREECNSIVTQTVEKHMRRLFDENRFDGIIQKAINRMLKEKSVGYDRTHYSIEAIVNRVAEKKIKDWIDENIRIGQSPELDENPG